VIRPVVIAAALATIAANCSNSSTATSGPTSTVHVALAVGPLPSTSALMVCSAQSQRELANALGISPLGPVVPTWLNHLYSCRLNYVNGAVDLSVKELSNKAETTAYFEMLSREFGDTGTVNGLGQGAFTTSNGSIVVRKDYKVLLVDISGLPLQFGVPPTSSADVAATFADVIIGCWSGA
jgi:hypothetical protein